MVLKVKQFFFSFGVFILIVRNVLSVEKQNISKLYNESDFIEIINTNSSFNLSFSNSEPNLKDLANGRMRSFLAEEEEEKKFSSKLFEIRSQTNVNLSENFNNDKKTKDSVYSYPIFNYQINSDTTSRSEKLIDSDFERQYIFPKLNDSKTNFTSNQKPKKPPYRFKNKQNNSNSFKAPNIIPFLQNNFENFNNISNFTEIQIISNKSLNNNNENNRKLINNEKILNEMSERRETNKTKYSSNVSQLKGENKTFESEKWLKYSDSHNITERFCVYSTDCDIELNERCIDRNKYSICGCKEPFFRDNLSQKCQIKKLIRLLFKVSSNHSNHLKSNSIEFIQTKFTIERNIWSIIMNSSHLLTVVDNIKVIELIDSKIVVDFYVKIANPSNNFHHKYIEYYFWYRLMSIIRGINFNSEENQLNSFNLRAIEIVDRIDYCTVKELNYCSDYAICLDNNDSEEKFECKCKSGMTDLSPNIYFKGEICALKCNSDLCGTGGVCEIRNDTEIHCICTNWKFGDRCQYSLYTFLCVAALFVVISIFFSVCLASLYCGYKIHEEFDKLRHLIEVLIEQNHSNVENGIPLI